MTDIVFHVPTGEWCRLAVLNMFDPTMMAAWTIRGDRLVIDEVRNFRPSKTTVAGGQPVAEGTPQPSR